MEDCQYESCRKCGKESHIPLRCDEVEKQKRADEGRLKVEEAISAAKIRHCPKCKTGFVKSDGCNKMACPCGVMLCYICREVLDMTNPYGHFCQEVSRTTLTIYSTVYSDSHLLTSSPFPFAATLHTRNLWQVQPEHKRRRRWPTRHEGGWRHGRSRI